MASLRVFGVAVLLIAGQLPASEIPSMAPGVPGNDALFYRIQQLEAETQMLRAELDHASIRQVPPAAAGGPRFSTVSSLAAEKTPEYVTREEVKDLAWKKGDFKIVPYGILWGTAGYETSRTYLGDYTLWAISPEDEGEDAFHVGARSTRLGIDVSGPELPWFCGAKSGGKVELDFQGSFAIENKPTVLLRHAYWEVQNDDYRLLVGQTWDVISPLVPGTIMYSVYWCAGNIGYRRPQVRYERYFDVSDAWQIQWQSSLNTDASSDLTTGVLADGDHAGWPIIEMRVGSTVGRTRPVSFGLSGHVGESIYDLPFADDVARPTWSVCADVKVPITERLGFQGEFFTGTDLKTFLGGINQGVDIGGTHDAIRSTGGWFEFWYDWTPRWHSHVGYSIDDPVDGDISLPIGRTSNQVYWGNITCDVTKKFQLGFEVSQWRTLFVDREAADATRFEFAGKYGF
ncbi:MAG: hypothetical protein ACOX1P_33435 [Thermoguttaceae bacterium]|jgi:hypothetical protein